MCDTVYKLSKGLRGQTNERALSSGCRKSRVSERRIHGDGGDGETSRGVRGSWHVEQVKEEARAQALLVSA